MVSIDAYLVRRLIICRFEQQKFLIDFFLYLRLRKGTVERETQDFFSFYSSILIFFFWFNNRLQSLLFCLLCVGLMHFVFNAYLTLAVELLKVFP